MLWGKPDHLAIGLVAEVIRAHSDMRDGFVSGLAKERGGVFSLRHRRSVGQAPAREPPPLQGC